MQDYTSGALDGYEQADVEGLLTNRLEKAKERLEETRESIKALCEPVKSSKGYTGIYRIISAGRIRPIRISLKKMNRKGLHCINSTLP